MKYEPFNVVPSQYFHEDFIYVPMRNGDLADYSGYYGLGNENYVEIPKEFDASLVVKGGSAANVTFTDVHRGWTYYMPAYDAVKLIREAMDNSESAVNGRFTIKKRGSNYRLYKVK